MLPLSLAGWNSGELELYTLQYILYFLLDGTEVGGNYTHTLILTILN